MGKFESAFSSWDKLLQSWCRLTQTSAQEGGKRCNNEQTKTYTLGLLNADQKRAEYSFNKARYWFAAVPSAKRGSRGSVLTVSGLRVHPPTLWRVSWKTEKVMKNVWSRFTQGYEFPYYKSIHFPRTAVLFSKGPEKNGVGERWRDSLRFREIVSESETISRIRRGIDGLKSRPSIPYRRACKNAFTPSRHRSGKDTWAQQIMCCAALTP